MSKQSYTAVDPTDSPEFRNGYVSGFADGLDNHSDQCRAERDALATEIATLKAAARELIDAVCYEPFPDRIEAAIAVLERIGV